MRIRIFEQVESIIQRKLTWTPNLGADLSPCREVLERELEAQGEGQDQMLESLGE